VVDGRRVRTFYLLDAAGNKTAAVDGAEGGGRHFTYATRLAPPPPGLEPPGTKLAGLHEVNAFLHACVRACGGGGGGGGGCGAGAAAPRPRAPAALPATLAPPPGAAAAAAAAPPPQACANATDSGVRRRAPPERFDPRPAQRAPSPGAAAADAAYARFALAAAAPGGAPQQQHHAHHAPGPQRALAAAVTVRHPPPPAPPLFGAAAAVPTGGGPMAPFGFFTPVQARGRDHGVLCGSLSLTRLRARALRCAAAAAARGCARPGCQGGPHRVAVGAGNALAGAGGALQGAAARAGGAHPNVPVRATVC
jgi:hypothetical protein